MAQTNFTPILTYKSDTATVVPSAGNLTNSANGAELAVNTADKRLFTKDSGGNVVELGTNPSSVTLPNGTANGVVFANGSKVLTTGSALTFDGTNLGVGTASPGNKLHVNGAGTTTIRLSNSADSTTLRLEADSNSLIVGSASNHPLVFRINDAEQMRLTSTGLGIGTSSPGSFEGTVKTVIGGGSGSPVLTLYGGSATYSAIYFADGVTGQEKYRGFFEYNHANDSMLFGTTGSTKATLDSSGNLGLGVTPSAWSLSGLQALQIKNASLAGYQNNSYLSANAYFSGGWRYVATDVATQYIQSAGQHQFFTAPSGTAGDAISFTQAMTLGADGLLQIGMTGGNVADGKLNVAATGTGAGTANTRLFMAGYELTSGNGAGLWFGARNNENTGVIGSRTASGNIAFETYSGAAWGERARITSGGDLLVGTTTQYGTQKLSVNGGIALDGRSAATPGLSEKSDDNTGIFWPAADTLGFTTNGTERARITSGGELLVGTTSADGFKFKVTNGAGNLARFTNGATQTLDVVLDSSGVIFQNPNDGYIAFKGASTERARITSGGELLVGLTSATGVAVLQVSGPIRTTGYTVATLPAGTVGMRTYVTDALAPAFGVAVAGSGAVTIPVFYDGANWIVA
jgi:hypothetical protein